MNARSEKTFFVRFDHALRQRLVAASMAISLACVASVVGCSGTPRASEPPANAPRVASPSAPSSPPDTPTARFRHHRSNVVVATGSPNHRARDVLAIEGDSVVIDAKIAYGPTDKDLADEDVRVDRETTDARWASLGVARTDRDGRLRFAAGALPVGSHRLRVTVLGDGSSADLSIVVVRAGQSVFVSDVDGTLTESETAEFPALLKKQLPPVHPSAADVFKKLVSRGFVPVYLTARPDWLLPRTRALLAKNDFPPGVVVTEKNYVGGYGTSAAAFKKRELGELVANGRTKIEWAFGNMPSDAETYAAFVTDPKRRVFYRYTDAAFGGRRIDSYADLLPDLSP